MHNDDGNDDWTTEVVFFCSARIEWPSVTMHVHLLYAWLCSTSEREKWRIAGEREKLRRSEPSFGGGGSREIVEGIVEGLNCPTRSIVSQKPFRGNCYQIIDNDRYFPKQIKRCLLYALRQPPAATPLWFYLSASNVSTISFSFIFDFISLAANYFPSHRIFRMHFDCLQHVLLELYRIFDRIVSTEWTRIIFKSISIDFSCDSFALSVLCAGCLLKCACAQRFVSNIDAILNAICECVLFTLLCSCVFLTCEVYISVPRMLLTPPSIFSSSSMCYSENSMSSKVHIHTETHTHWVVVGKNAATLILKLVDGFFSAVSDRWLRKRSNLLLFVQVWHQFNVCTFAFYSLSMNNLWQMGVVVIYRCEPDGGEVKRRFRSTDCSSTYH